MAETHPACERAAIHVPPPSTLFEIPATVEPGQSSYPDPPYRFHGVWGSIASATFPDPSGTQLNPASVLLYRPAYIVPEFSGSMTREETGMARGRKYTFHVAPPSMLLDTPFSVSA